MTQEEKTAREKNQRTEDAEDMGGVPYDGTVDIEEVIIDEQIYEIDETD